jgi:hypothetical protein
MEGTIPVRVKPSITFAIWQVNDMSLISFFNGRGQVDVSLELELPRFQEEW